MYSTIANSALQHEEGVIHVALYLALRLWHHGLKQPHGRRGQTAHHQRCTLEAKAHRLEKDQLILVQPWGEAVLELVRMYSKVHVGVRQVRADELHFPVAHCVVHGPFLVELPQRGDHV